MELPMGLCVATCLMSMSLKKRVIFNKYRTAFLLMWLRIGKALDQKADNS
ncbi:hypothetical protein KDH83_10990 [Achromobacter sp. Marseille-Q0513]|nr:hypothetical protein [Achromobacter sp. Marseille-Q0513]MBR8653828.1 hypothetical protein [Achromobacter sp. Marseille-Q0513]